jgi:hypothetical protein
MVKPDGMADDAGGKRKTTVVGRAGIRQASLSNPDQLDNTHRCIFGNSLSY